MNIKPETRDILRQYKALINARRRDADQRELTTAQVVDEICEYMTLPVCRVHRRSLHLTGRKRQVSRMAGGYAACQPARKTMQAAACGGRTRAALRAAPRPFPP